jgi:hypothetical protein
VLIIKYIYDAGCSSMWYRGWYYLYISGPTEQVLTLF